MSYKCNKCGNVHHGKMLRIVTAVRPVSYEGYINKFNRETKETEKMFVSQYKGKEIVREEALCEPCYNIHKITIPEETAKDKYVDFLVARKSKLKTQKELAQEKAKENARRKRDKSKLRRPKIDDDKDIG